MNELNKVWLILSGCLFLSFFATGAGFIVIGVWQSIAELRRNNWQWRSLFKYIFRAGWPLCLRVFWIMCGICLPLVAICTERLTEICARAFFDPLPTDWHLLLFALIPFSNLAGELLSVRWVRERAAWLGGPLLKWVNGMAISVSAFYAAWFLPMALICSTLLLIGFFAFIYVWLSHICIALFTHPSELLVGCGAVFWVPPLVIPSLALILLIPAAPLMSFLACLRIRSQLFATQPQIAGDNAIQPEPKPAPPTHPGFIALGVLIFGVSFFLMFKFWLPYVFSSDFPLLSNFSKVSLKYLLLTFAPPLLLFGMLLWPSAISPLSWFGGTRETFLQWNSKNKPFERVFLPAAFGLFALLAIEIPSTATRVAMNMALDPNKSTQGLLLLRAFGNDDSMLRMCYERSHATDVIGSILTWGQPVSAEKAREMYYRATGKPFNTRHVPASFRGKIHDFPLMSVAGADDVFDWDTELAGETVGGVVRGVSLANSNIKGEIDAAAHMAKLDWEMQFENKSQFLREARAQVLLPPHAVVSGVWLWINGKPHPAAFNSRGLTRAAYKAVVKKRRDPLLVTTYGPDRVLAQCFPVPPKGTMRIKLRITSPLEIGADGKAYLPMPIFLERNFRVGSHTLALSANDKISNPAGILQGGKANQSVCNLNGTMLNEDLCLGKGTVVMDGKFKDNSSWGSDIAGGDNIILENIHRLPIKKPKKLVIVIDGSAAMAENASSLAQVLRSVPEGIHLSLIRAGDKVEVIADDVPDSSDSKWPGALESLQSQTFVGGQDDVAALVKAFDFIHDHEPAAILWVHGPQPVKIEKTDALADLLKRNQFHVSLYELQMENGPNRTAEALDGIENVNRLPATISCEASLKDLFYLWAGDGSGRYEISFDKVNPNDTLTTSIASKSTIDMSPLWANQEIAKLRSAGATGKSEDAVEIAKQYRVVTPVSGAVVLETDADYKRYGLTAPPAESKVTGHLSELKELAKTASHPFESQNALSSLKPEFEQKQVPSASAAQPDSANDTNPVAVTDNSVDVSAVPEPSSWLFLLSIGGLLWLFRKKMALRL